MSDLPPEFNQKQKSFSLPTGDDESPQFDDDNPPEPAAFSSDTPEAVNNAASGSTSFTTDVPDFTATMSNQHNRNFLTQSQLAEQSFDPVSSSSSTLPSIDSKAAPSEPSNTSQAGVRKQTTDIGKTNISNNLVLPLPCCSTSFCTQNITVDISHEHANPPNVPFRAPSTTVSSTFNYKQNTETEVFGGDIPLEPSQGDEFVSSTTSSTNHYHSHDSLMDHFQSSQTSSAFMDAAIEPPAPAFEERNEGSNVRSRVPSMMGDSNHTPDLVDISRSSPKTSMITSDPRQSTNKSILANSSNHKHAGNCSQFEPSFNKNSLETKSNQRITTDPGNSAKFVENDAQFSSNTLSIDAATSSLEIVDSNISMAEIDTSANSRDMQATHENENSLPSSDLINLTGENPMNNSGTEPTSMAPIQNFQEEAMDMSLDPSASPRNTNPASFQDMNPTLNPSLESTSKKVAETMPVAPPPTFAHPNDPSKCFVDGETEDALLAQILEYGFAENIAMQAIRRTHGTGLSEAVNWIIDHSTSEEAEIEEIADRSEELEGAINQPNGPSSNGAENQKQQMGSWISTQGRSGDSPSTSSSSSLNVAGNGTPLASVLRAVRPARAYKMIFVANMGLKMGAGKLAAQVGHATLGVYRQAQKSEEGKKGLRKWTNHGEVKIVVKGQTTEQLMDLHRQANNAGLYAYLVQDAGYTQIPPGSRTVLGIFGAVETVDAITGTLKLL